MSSMKAVIMTILFKLYPWTLIKSLAQNKGSENSSLRHVEINQSTVDQMESALSPEAPSLG